MELVCRHCDESIRPYDLAYMRPLKGNPHYVHAGENNGWFSCFSAGAITYAEPLVSPYLWGDEGEQLDLAWKKLRLAVWYPILRLLRRLGFES